MAAEQEISIILEEAEQNLKELGQASQDQIYQEKIDALKECVLILSRKIDENSEYLTDLYKEMSRIKEKL
ncbi:MAG: hypothetical protein PHN32_08045 [Actinomycetota bacterium]|jgi:hypothetical protein|nr:hypothetical protein [Actinomycetota bacterium]